MKDVWLVLTRECGRRRPGERRLQVTKFAASKRREAITYATRGPGGILTTGENPPFRYGVVWGAQDGMGGPCGLCGLLVGRETA